MGRCFMIRQKFILKEYDWSVQVYYAVDCYYSDEIMEALYSIGCRGKNLSVAFGNLSSCKLDTGLTYSNYSTHETVMVIGINSSAEEFMNSFCHERKHLEMHIAKAFDLNPWGEEVAYLSGKIGQKMYRVAKKFLCEHCRKLI